LLDATGAVRERFDVTVETPLERVAHLCFILLIVSLPWSIAAISITTALCATSTVALWIRTRNWRAFDTPVLWPTAGWLAALVVCALTALDPPASMTRVGKGFLPLLVPLAAFHTAERRRGELALKFLFLSSLVASLVGLALFLAHGASFPTRARGASGHYMTYAGQMLLLTSLALAVALLARRAPWRRGAVLTALMGAIALGATYTRSAWIGFAAAIGVMLAAARLRWLPALAILIVGAYFLAPGEYRVRIRSAFEPHHETNQQRLYMWEAGLRMFRDHPLTGVGLQDMKPVYDQYRSPGSRERAGHLHSVPIQIAASMGIIGIAAFAALCVGLFHCAASGLREMLRVPSTAAGVRLGIVAALCGFLIAGLFEWNFGDEELLYLLYVMVGMAWSARQWEPPS
jgi:O-antigen ligase